MSLQQLVVVKPLQVVPAMLVSTDVPETDYPEWTSGDTYDNKERVIVASVHKVFESTADGNVNKNPLTDTTGAWLEVSATNRWKAFDKSVSTQTAQADAMSYRIKPGQAITTLAALNIKGATSMRVRVVDPTFGTVYDKTVSLGPVPVSSGWWAWYFGERRMPTQAILRDLPSFPGADVLIDFVGTDELAVGVILMGQARTFGRYVNKGARVGIQDYSRKERTDFGDVIVVERAFAKRANVTLLLDANQVDDINQFMAEIRATPCLWLATDRFEATVLYAFYKFYDISISYYDYSNFELELEGLT